MLFLSQCAFSAMVVSLHRHCLCGKAKWPQNEGCIHTVFCRYLWQLVFKTTRSYASSGTALSLSYYTRPCMLALINSRSVLASESCKTPSVYVVFVISAREGSMSLCFLKSQRICSLQGAYPMQRPLNWSLQEAKVIYYSIKDTNVRDLNAIRQFVCGRSQSWVMWGIAATGLISATLHCSVWDSAIAVARPLFVRTEQELLKNN